MWYRILPQVLNMTLTASIVILCILPARLALKRAPKILSYALWGVVLFRLLCPVAPTSDLSLMNLSPMNRTRFADVNHSSHTSSAELIPSDLVESVVNPQWMTQSPTTPTKTIGQNPTILLNAEPYPLAAPITIATLLWLAGILALVIYSLRSLWQLRRQLVTSMPLRDNIYLADHISTPFVLGILRPRVYLPSSLDKDQQTYILLHERHHIHRLDHVFKLLAFWALCLHWFNPLVWLAFVLAGKDMEMSCDEAVLRRMGDGIRADYSASLLNLATGQRILAGAPLAFGQGDTRDRIHHVLSWKQPRTWIVVSAIIACGILAVSLLTNPSKHPGLTAARYRVEQILYDAPQYDFTYVPETAPDYTITSDYVLMRRSGTDETAAWETVGGLYQVDYSRQELYSLFDPLYCTAHEQLDQVAVIYRTETENSSTDSFYLVMQTKGGDILLAYGYGEDLTGHVRWLFALEKIIVKQGSYYMLPEGGDRTYPSACLSLQDGSVFTFTYDPLSSYLNYGHYTVQDNILKAVTDDGLYQFCFDVADEKTLAFIESLSSDVSRVDDRLVEPLTDGAVFRLQ